MNLFLYQVKRKERKRREAKKNKRGTQISPYDLKESCRFKGIPSCPKPSSSSVCLGSRTGSVGGPVLDSTIDSMLLGNYPCSKCIWSVQEYQLKTQRAYHQPCL
uniref:Non-imprinted in Prader-Willi/Angelman syndrome region protein n=1 Tax=Solanum tuberosum TaxID=4113 RepID=M1CBP4_SOLTU